jgi:hypothetical protein
MVKKCQQTSGVDLLIFFVSIFLRFERLDEVQSFLVFCRLQIFAIWIADSRASNVAANLH